MGFLFCFALFLTGRKAGLLEEGHKFKPSHYWLFPVPSSTHWMSQQGLTVLPPLLVQENCLFTPLASLWVARVTLTITIPAFPPPMLKPRFLTLISFFFFLSLAWGGNILSQTTAEFMGGTCFSHGCIQVLIQWFCSPFFFFGLIPNFFSAW